MNQGRYNTQYQEKQAPKSQYPFYAIIQNQQKREISFGQIQINTYMLNVDEEILFSDFFQIIKIFNIKYKISDISSVSDLRNKTLPNFDQILIKRNKQNRIEFISFQNSYVLNWEKYQNLTLNEQLKEFEEFFQCDGEEITLLDLFQIVQKILSENKCFQLKSSEFTRASQQSQLLYIIKQRFSINFWDNNKQYSDSNYYINQLSINNLLLYFDFFYCAKKEQIIEIEKLWQTLFSQQQDAKIQLYLQNLQSQFKDNLNPVRNQQSKKEDQKKEEQQKENLFSCFKEVVNQKIKDQFVGNKLLLEQFEQCELLQAEILKQFNKYYGYLNLKSDNLKQNTDIELDDEIMKQILRVFLESYIQFINREIYQGQKDEACAEAEYQTKLALFQFESLKWYDFEKVIYNYCCLIKRITKQDVWKLFTTNEQLSELDSQLKEFIHRPNSYQQSLEWLSNKFCNILFIQKSEQFTIVKKNLQDIKQVNVYILQSFNMICTNLSNDQRILIQKCYNQLIQDMNLWDNSNQFLVVIYSDEFSKKLKEIELSLIDLAYDKVIKISSQGVINNDYQKYFLQFLKIPLYKAYVSKKQDQFIETFKQALGSLKTKDEEYCQQIQNKIKNIELNPMEKLFIGLGEEIKNLQQSAEDYLDGLALLISFVETNIKKLRQNDVENKCKTIIESIHTLVEDKINQLLKVKISLQPYELNFEQLSQIEDLQETVLEYYQQEIYKQLKAI